MTRKTIPNSQSTICNPQSAIRSGSAIILAIVLTTLLAILGVLFLLSSRVDSVTTSAVGDNHDLKLAVDTVVAQISEVISSDVPRTDANGVPIEEYYDYPDNLNPWLASLEPNYSGVWPHVTDLYYPQFGPLAYNLPPGIIYDHNDRAAYGIPADADGDGVSDSMWVQVPGKASSKGKPIYVAVRIIDNGGMLNVNTGYKFDPCGPIGSIDGSSQTQINLMVLAGRPGYTLFNENTLKNMRANYPVSGLDPNNLGLYEQDVIWQYGLPNGAYTPFDISDELEMRYRFVIDQNDTHTRLEAWSKEFPRDPYKLVQRDPFDNSAGANKFDWLKNVYGGGSLDPNYAYRHITTTYNCDRIINPAGQKMFNINSPSNFNKILIYDAVSAALDPSVFSSIDVALITANLMDYIDGNDYPPSDPRYDPNNNVTVVYDDVNTPHYGFERPCIYISEIAQNFYQPDINEPNVYRSFAIELFKPYWEDDEPNGWQIITEGLDAEGNPLPSNTTTIVWTGSRRFHVLADLNVMAMIPIEINEPNDVNYAIDYNYPRQPQSADINFGPGTRIYLYRDVNGFGPYLVDVFAVPPAEWNGSWMDYNNSPTAYKSAERDIASIHKCIRRILNLNMTTPTIGYMNHPFNSGGDMIQAHPQNREFTNIGEIGQLFRTNAYGDSINKFSMEAEVRLNLADPNVQKIFKYLTVIDPRDHSPIDPNETRIKGRININTAPWFVLAQLPWVSYHTPNYDLARSIVAYRDKTVGPGGIDYTSRSGPYGFGNIGELMTDANGSPYSIGYYEGKGSSIPTTLLTPTDGVGDAFEERDVIFDRISNLITVRSDVFTAYILVRIGTDGPQKRVIAILDRSEAPAKKVKVIAIQQVPDPR
jgi:hypothetical protein